MKEYVNQLENRFDYVKSVVEKEVHIFFSGVFDQLERRKKALSKERCTREAAWISKEDFKARAKRINEKISEELSCYERTDIGKWLPDSIDDEFVEMCDEEPDKKFVNLIVFKLIWDHSRKASGLQKLYKKKWLTNLYHLEIKWICSNCQNPNIKKFARRSIPNLEQYKCPKCGIVFDSYGKSFRFDWENPISGKTLKEGAWKLRETILNYTWPSEKSSSYEVWNLQDQYIVFHRNKHKLPHSVRKFLDFFNELPKSTDLRKDFDIATEECQMNLTQLEKFGLIKIYTSPRPYVEIALELVDGLHFSYESVQEHIIGGGYVCPFNKNVVDNTFYYLEGDISFYNYTSPYLKDISFNKCFFENSALAIYSAPKEERAGFIRKVFNSKAEKRHFETLRKKLPKNLSILPNYPTNYVFDFRDKTLKNEFKKDELEYLKKSIFDFVIIDEEGLPVEIQELQLGIHHKNPEYNERDLLKKRLCEFAGVNFKEIF